MDDQSQAPNQQNTPPAPGVTSGQVPPPSIPVQPTPQNMSPINPVPNSQPVSSSPQPLQQVPQMPSPSPMSPPPPMQSVPSAPQVAQPLENAQTLPSSAPLQGSSVPSNPAQNVPPSSSQDMPLRHVPDLTASQQVAALSNVPAKESASPTPMPSSPPSGVPPQDNTPVKKPASSGKKPSLIPKPLLFVIVGFAALFILFVAFKVLAGFFGQNTGGKVTLTYWGLWEDTSMQAVLTDFERQHPNISVTYSKQDPHEYSKSVITRIQNGSGPDIFRYHVSWLPMLTPSLLPLSTQAITKSDFSKNYFPVMQQDLVYNGALYGIPLEVDTLALFVNKKMLEDGKMEVPTTWDSYIDVARTLTKKDDSGKIQVAGAALGTYDNITHAPDIISLLLVQNGVDLKTMTPASNASDALTFYTSFAKDSDNVWDTTLDPSLLAFEKGKLAMYIGYSWDIFAIQAASPDLQFGIYPVPHLPGRNSTIASYWVEGISSKTKYPKESMELLHFLTQKDTLTKLYTLEAKSRSFGEPYPRVDLAPLLKSNNLVYPFVQQASLASSSFFAGDTFDTGINAQMNGYLGNAVNSMLKDTSADTAVETLTKGVSQILAQYGQQ